MLPVVLLDPAAGQTTWMVPHRTAGTIDHAAIGTQGDSPAPGLFAIETLPRTVRDVSNMTVRGRGTHALVDAVLVQPEVEHVVLTHGAGSTAVVRNFAHHRRTVVLALPAGTTATVATFDAADTWCGRPRPRREQPSSRHHPEIRHRPQLRRDCVSWKGLVTSADAR
ncbi:MAG: hypothetical protein ACRD0U_11005 [Acidimicrobiales bacterium]